MRDAGARQRSIDRCWSAPTIDRSVLERTDDRPIDRSRSISLDLSISNDRPVLERADDRSIDRSRSIDSTRPDRRVMGVAPREASRPAAGRAAAHRPFPFGAFGVCRAASSVVLSRARASLAGSTTTGSTTTGLHGDPPRGDGGRDVCMRPPRHPHEHPRPLSRAASRAAVRRRARAVTRRRRSTR